MKKKHQKKQMTPDKILTAHSAQCIKKTVPLLLLLLDSDTLSLVVQYLSDVFSFEGSVLNHLPPSPQLVFFVKWRCKSALPDELINLHLALWTPSATRHAEYLLVAIGITKDNKSQQLTQVIRGSPAMHTVVADSPFASRIVPFFECVKQTYFPNASGNEYCRNYNLTVAGLS